MADPLEQYSEPYTIADSLTPSRQAVSTPGGPLGADPAEKKPIGYLGDDSQIPLWMLPFAALLGLRGRRGAARADLAGEQMRFREEVVRRQRELEQRFPPPPGPERRYSTSPELAGVQPDYMAEFGPQGVMDMITGRRLPPGETTNPGRAANFRIGAGDFAEFDAPQSRPPSNPNPQSRPQPTQAQRDLYALPHIGDINPDDPMWQNPRRQARALDFWDLTDDFMGADAPISRPVSTPRQDPNKPTPQQRALYAMPLNRQLDRPLSAYAGARMPRTVRTLRYGEAFDNLEPPPRDKMHADGGVVLAQYFEPSMLASRRTEPSAYRFRLPQEQRDIPEDMPSPRAAPPRQPQPQRSRPQYDPLQQEPLRADGGPVKPLAQYTRPAFETTNPVVNFMRDMNAGRLSGQQAVRGWLQEHPTAQAFAQRLPMLPLAIGNPSVSWAGRTPGIVRGIETLAPPEGGPTITGGLPNSSFPIRDAITLQLTPITESSTGLQARFPATLRANSRMGYREHDPMPQAHYDRLRNMLEQGPANLNRPKTNLRTPNERGWWLRRPIDPEE